MVSAFGIAAPGVAMEFGFDKAQVGSFTSFSILGLLFGAAFGGRLADRYGRKAVLLWSLAIFGVFSLGTAYAWDYPSMLAVRFLTGLGLGGAMANLVALSSEAAPDYQGTAVGLVYMGLPLGSTITALIGAAITPPEWRTVFYVGGFIPLIRGSRFWLSRFPVVRYFKACKGTAWAKSTSTMEALFGGGRTLTSYDPSLDRVLLRATCDLSRSQLDADASARSKDLINARMERFESLFSVGSAIGTAGFWRVARSFQSSRCGDRRFRLRCDGAIQPLSSIGF